MGSLRTVLPVIALCFITFTAVVPVNGSGLGDRLLRTFGLFIANPLTAHDALKNGWVNVSSSCNPQSGWTFVDGSSEPTSYKPSILYYTSAGQLAGFGMRVWADVPQQLVDAGLWLPVSGKSGVFDVFVATRSADLMCSGKTSSDVVGDRLVINGKLPIELNNVTATKAGWVMGNCIPLMGIHYAFDITSPGKNTWDARTLAPLMPMYDAVTGRINSVLFNIWTTQSSEPFGIWEPALSSSSMCYNWCASSGCHWDGVNNWNTLHFHFVSPWTISSCSTAPCSL